MTRKLLTDVAISRRESRSGADAPSAPDPLVRPALPDNRNGGAASYIVHSLKGGPHGSSRQNRRQRQTGRAFFLGFEHGAIASLLHRRSRIPDGQPMDQSGQTQVVLAGNR